MRFWRLLAAVVAVTSIRAEQAQQDESVTPSAKTYTGRFSLSPLSAEGATLEDLIRFAYSVRDFQIVGGPAWIKSERYDVRAGALGGPVRDFVGKPLPPLQKLLKDKFQLKLHGESRELAIFKLRVSQYGGDLRKSRVARCATFDFGRYSPPPGERPKDCSAVLTGPNRQLNETLDGVGMSVAQLIDMLSRELDRIVVDKTQLTGLYDIVLEWNRAATSQRVKTSITEDPDNPSLFEALEQQLGLKLEAAKGPVEVLVIDHAEKPAER